MKRHEGTLSKALLASMVDWVKNNDALTQALLTFGINVPEESVASEYVERIHQKVFTPIKARGRSAFALEDHEPAVIYATADAREVRQELLKLKRSPDTRLPKKLRDYQLNNLAKKMTKDK